MVESRKRHGTWGRNGLVSHRSELQSHAAYLEHWIALLQAEPQVLFQVLGEARQAVELIAPEGVAASEKDS